MSIFASNLCTMMGRLWFIYRHMKLALETCNPTIHIIKYVRIRVAYMPTSELKHWSRNFES